MGSTVVNDLGASQPHRREEPSDEVVEQFIAAHPAGAPLELIAEQFGWSRSRAGQVLKQALEKCLKKARARGLDATDFPSRETLWDRM